MNFNRLNLKNTIISVSGQNIVNLLSALGAVCVVGYAGFRLAWHFNTNSRDSIYTNLLKKPDHEKVLAIQEIISEIVQFEDTYDIKTSPPPNLCVIIPFMMLASSAPNVPSKSDFFQIAIIIYEKFIEQVFNINPSMQSSANLAMILPLRGNSDNDLNPDTNPASLEELFEEGYRLFKSQIHATCPYDDGVLADIETRRIAISTLYQEVIGGLFSDPGLLQSYSDFNVSTYYTPL